MLDISEAMEELVDICLHDFLNVLQVVGGLTQLNKLDRVMAYIRNTSEEFQQFGRLINCGDPRLALLIYKELLQPLDGKYFLDVKGVMPLLPVEMFEGLERTLKILQQQLKQGEEGQVAVKINGIDFPTLTISVFPKKEQLFSWGEVIDVASKNGMMASVGGGVHLLLNLDKSVTGG